jgi:glycosyltransferase involved in cell wall biosynthesis
MKSNPFFSIVIPTYNRADLLKKTLESFVKQTFEDFEVIIVDDGGKDHTKEVVESFGETRFRYYWKENEERNVARNYGANLALGKYINWFDSDDLAYKNHLISAFNIIKSNLEIVFFCTGQDIRTVNNKIIKKSLNKNFIGNNKIIKQNFTTLNSVFLKKNVWEKDKFCIYKNLLVGEDWVYLIIISLKYKFYCFCSISTNSIINHSTRTMNNLSGQKVILSLYDIINYFIYKKVNKKIINQIESEMYLQSSLFFALNNKKYLSIRYLLIGIKKNYYKIFSRKTIAIIKHLILI